MEPEPGRLVCEYDAEHLPPESKLDRAVGDVVEDVREFLDQPAPWGTTQVAADLGRIVPAIDVAIGLVRQMEQDSETAAEVVDGLER